VQVEHLLHFGAQLAIPTAGGRHLHADRRFGPLRFGGGHSQGGTTATIVTVRAVATYFGTIPVPL
jgi:hypothetical protein